MQSSRPNAHRDAGSALPADRNRRRKQFTPQIFWAENFSSTYLSLAQMGPDRERWSVERKSFHNNAQIRNPKRWAPGVKEDIRARTHSQSCEFY
jgi:hypothetical protein